MTLPNINSTRPSAEDPIQALSVRLEAYHATIINRLDTLEARVTRLDRDTLERIVADRNSINQNASDMTRLTARVAKLDKDTLERIVEDRNSIKQNASDIRALSETVTKLASDTLERIIADREAINKNGYETRGARALAEEALNKAKAQENNPSYRIKRSELLDC